MHANKELITRFYTAFAHKDYKGMQACYDDNVLFNDNAFTNLKGNQAKAMWHMLLLAAIDMELTFENIQATETTGSADWKAVYTFSLTGNKVINMIHADFELSNGKISKHTDTFDFYKWASQAFGLRGILIGWTTFFKKKVQATTRQRLQAFIDKNPGYK